MEDLINWNLIDKDDVLERLLGSVNFLKKLLINYYENHNNLEFEMEELMVSENYEDALMLIHKIKGVSANLSMKKLNRASLNFESSLKNKSYENVEELKNNFISSHNEIIHMIEKMI